MNMSGKELVWGLVCLLLVSVMDAQAQARITASTMDSNGNVYVTGWRVRPSIIADIITIKYDKNGTMLWSHSFPDDPARPDSEGWGIAVDPSGNVYVAGHVGTAENVDCLLIKYPHDYAQGDEPEWVRTYEGGGFDQNWTMAVDSDGYVYVTGYSQQVTNEFLNSDIVTMKYNKHGDMVWGTPRFYNGPANLRDDGFAIAVDPVTRNVYVTGATRNNAEATSHDMVTVMYDRDGTEKWVRRYAGPVNGHNKGTSVALDGEGNAYVAGWSQKTVAPVNLDMVTVKYDVGGNEMWVARYDGPAGSNDQPAPPAGFQLGSSGSTYSYVQNNQGIVVTSEPVDPVPAVEYLIGKVSGLDVNRGIQVSLLAKLNACLDSLVAANADVRRNANNILGAFINQVQSAAVGNRVAAEDANEMIAVANEIIKGKTVVYVGGQSTGVGTGVDFAVIKYKGTDGSPMWNLPGQPGTAAGKPGSPADIALRYNGPANGTDRIWATAMDLDGNLYVAGPSTEASARSVDFFTIKYFVRTGSPTMLGTGRYNGPGNGVDQACGFATWRDPASGRQYIFRDPDTGEDYVSVTGNSIGLGTPAPQEYTTIVYDGALGLRWVQKYF